VGDMGRSLRLGRVLGQVSFEPTAGRAPHRIAAPVAGRFLR
jgi:hypothetical protein